eukprot:1148766-Pelagomonas_calceolata.AAC.15
MDEQHISNISASPGSQVSYQCEHGGQVQAHKHVRVKARVIVCDQAVVLCAQICVNVSVRVCTHASINELVSVLYMRVCICMCVRVHVHSHSQIHMQALACLLHCTSLPTALASLLLDVFHRGFISL